ncbi:SWI/SNF-related matrix-associated actin-dependent regulator of chromatin subfamily E member 1-related-like [Ylistrum balloti]|uniref:SWI/SNF-related matrix-associated actin-dependent regulator of chromatin subfamily E member 1-related-like n=1 Tax=Ylistrum balloti TaxID=509963 RepID=UPI002905D086|nr:SWI/SNF-related matrix-associated actin-dependent regulator of chromatin subfamily E member 1-related-like [Ylistrum balloti]
MDHHEMLNITDGNSAHHPVLAVTEPVAIDALGATSKGEQGETLISTTTAATLLPEHGGLVLVETSRGNLLLSVNGDTLGTVSYTDADIQGRQILTTALPMTGILTQNGLVESQGTTLLINQPSTPGDGAVVCEGTFDTSVSTLQTDQLLTSKSPLSNTPSSGDQSTEKKRRGGWPKGKRRKPTPDFSTPRAPASGYLLYAIERRQEIKGSNPEIPFSEVTKILGQEWSSMSADKKQKYLEEADNDKKRYIEELKTYQNTVKKKMKAGIRGEEGDWENEENYSQLMSVDMEEDGLNDLYCRICDKYFSSLHNKKEHMLGRQHVQNMAGEMHKDTASTSQPATLSPTQRPVPPDLGTDSNQSDSLPVGDKESPPLDIGGFIQNFIHDNYERELELQEIRKSLKNLQEENLSLYKQINELKIYQNKLEDDTANHKAIGANLSSQTDTLKMVLTLFGVINYQG